LVLFTVERRTVCSIAIQHEGGGFLAAQLMACFDTRFVSRGRQVQCVVHGVRGREHFRPDKKSSHEAPS
jgi:hypothetical protein